METVVVVRMLMTSRRVVQQENNLQKNNCKQKIKNSLILSLVAGLQEFGLGLIVRDLKGCSTLLGWNKVMKIKIGGAYRYCK